MIEKRIKHMAGTKAGSIKARATMIKNMGGEEAYNAHLKAIGAAGGRNSNTGGFGNGEQGRELAKRAGKIGGTVSRRSKPTIAPVIVEAPKLTRWQSIKALMGQTNG